jgi:prolyl oligopeptidase
LDRDTSRSSDKGSKSFPLNSLITLSTDGTVSLGGISISKNCKTLAYSISKSGSDWQEIHFKDLTTKKDLPDVIKWVKFSGMAWKGNGIYYSRYDEPTGSAFSQKNTGHKLYFHELGKDQSKDVLVFKDDAHPDHNFSAQVTNDERFLIMYTSQSTSGEMVMLKDLNDPKAQFTKLSDNFDNEYSIIDNIGNTFYLLTNKGAPKYKLESFIFMNGKIAEYKTIIPESKDLMEGVRLSNNQIVVNYLQDAVSRLYVYDLNGKLKQEIVLPGLCKINGFNSDKAYNFATYSISQFIAPEQVYYLDMNTFQSKLIFKPNTSFQSDQYVTKQVFYNSKDGTRIPMFVTYKKGLSINAETPCFVYGYGGFNISLGPEFRIDRALFLEAGGIYCVPNLRGGGEYGEEWHKAGTK